MICFIDYRASDEEISNLKKLNLDIIKIPKCKKVYGAIDGHVDIQLNILNKSSKEVIVHKDISSDFLSTLKSKNIKYTLSNSSLSNKYPGDILLNALILDSFFIHNLKYTDKTLLSFQKEKELLNVKQGYTKCSVLPISDSAFITSDIGIFNVLKELNKDVLLLPPGDILLPELNYGFIGGIGGIIDSGKLGIFGELEHYKYGDDVYKFLYKHNVEPISLKKGKLIDRGSLFVL